MRLPAARLRHELSLSSGHCVSWSILRYSPSHAGLMEQAGAQAGVPVEARRGSPTDLSFQVSMAIDTSLRSHKSGDRQSFAQVYTVRKKFSRQLTESWTSIYKRNTSITIRYRGGLLHC